MNRFEIALLSVIVGCQGRATESDSKATAATAADASPAGSASVEPHMNTQVAEEIVSAACKRLVSQGVAKACDRAEHDSASASAKFTLAGGFPGDVGRVRFWPVERDYADAGRTARDYKTDGQDSDDYPNIWATSTALRMSVYWRAQGESPNDAWDMCRIESTPKACAQKYPAQYAYFERLYRAAVMVANNEKSAASPEPHPTATPASEVPSDTCHCNDGTIGCCHRGCCSHHGGIGG